jgi:hypothetical protein
MRNTKWLNTTQPQTLVNATILLYITAAFLVLSGGLAFIVPIAGKVGAGYGIANEKKWGWILGLAITGLTVLGRLAFGINFAVLIGSAFEILLLVLLLHPQSREYQRIWFK